jgi:PIN domain nuclease of toxin-antitoxin system
MYLLVDTQVFIGLINDDESLGAKTNKALHDPSNDIYLNYFSVYEMLIKSSAGKLEYDDTVLDELPNMGI